MIMKLSVRLRHGLMKWGFRAVVVAGVPSVQAQMGLPTAPFVFMGDVHHVSDPLIRLANDYSIQGRAVIDVRGGAAAQLSGVLSNAAGSASGLIKLGGGTLMLSGPNTYAGSTQLLQGGFVAGGNRAWGKGTLHANLGTRLTYSPGVVIDSALQLRSIDIAVQMPPGSYTDIVPPDYAGSVQWAVPSGHAVHAGILAGGAPFVKQGAGRLTISGDAMAYLGAATVNEGTLAINEIFSGVLWVNRGARLQGTGTVGSTTVRSGGTLAPGNSVGALTVNGDLVFMPGSRFEIEAGPRGIADSLRVTGAALLDGDVFAFAQAGDWQASNRYVVLSAGGGLQGSRFASVSSDFAFLTPSLSYDANQVTLTLTRNDTPLEEAAETPAEEEVAQVIDREGPNGPDNPGLHDQVVALDKPSASAAFGQLSGSWAASVQSSLVDDSRFIREAVLGQAGTDGFWGRAFYSSADRRASNGVLADSRSIHGMVLGINRSVSRKLSLGAFLGAQRSHLWRSQSMADAGVDSTHAGVSLAGRGGYFAYSAGVAHTWHAIKSHRAISAGGLRDALASRYRGQSTQVFAEASWPVSLGSQKRIEPFARLAWVRAGVDGYTEQGGAAALRVLPTKQSVLFSTLGVRFRQALEASAGKAEVQVQAGWRHASGTGRFFTLQRFRDSASQALFRSEGQGIARNAWQLEAGITGQLAKHIDLGMSYAGQFASARQDHGARLNLTWAF